jgi:hypothetical protein
MLRNMWLIRFRRARRLSSAWHHVPRRDRRISRIEHDLIGFGVVPPAPHRFDVHRAQFRMLDRTGDTGRYRERGVVLYFRADAAFAKPEIYELLEPEGVRYAIRLPANQVLQRRIGHLLSPIGRPPKTPVVTFASFRYQAKGWTQARRVVWHHGQLCPRVGFIVTNLSRPAKRGVKFYNGRGTAEQHIKERQKRAPLDAAVLSRLPAKRRAAPAARAGLQPGQLHAHIGPARGGRALVADDAAREAGQDRRQDRAPRPLRRVPAGRGGGAESAVRRDPAPDRPAQAEAAPHMTTWRSTLRSAQERCAHRARSTASAARLICRGRDAACEVRHHPLCRVVGQFEPALRIGCGGLASLKKPPSVAGQTEETLRLLGRRTGQLNQDADTFAS